VQVEWRHPRCLICLEEKPLSREHVIPDSLGGKLTANILCVHCNSRFGHGPESKAPSDPAIRIAAFNLRAEIPDLSAAILKHADYVSFGPGGIGKGKIREGVYREKFRREPDGSTIQPTHLGRESLVKRLEKAGVDKRRISRTLDVFDGAPDNAKIEVSAGLGFAKWSIDKVEPALHGGEPLHDVVPLKIAYEYVALHLGAALLADDTGLVEIRRALREADSHSPAFSVEQLSSGEYSSHHGVAIEQGEPNIIVHIMLFGWLRFRVHLHYLAMGSDRLVYTHDLKTGRESLTKHGETSP
jgi:HNH endonuclease